MKRVLVTGANGQLGMCIKDVANEERIVEFIFTERAQLDITKEYETVEFFKNFKPDYCINCAAYTAVDKAEEEPEKAFLVNATGAKNLALACKNIGTILIHVSTDYVFDGTKNTPYLETDPPNPINVYGKSKLEGERYIQEILPEHFIIRTSWLYSQFGNNFFNTMIKLGLKKEKISVITDQVGCPSNAVELAKFLIEIIKINLKEYGVLNFSNIGQTTWFEFANEIFDLLDYGLIINPVSTKSFSSVALRPQYSTLSIEKLESLDIVKVSFWRSSLLDLVNKLKDAGIIEN
jgi:dTDP-4-dehydrorhamnose reductase